MDAAFWHERWEGNRIAFHEGEANALLAAHFPTLALEPGARVFVPLCGKTRDIAWLLDRGYRVAGAELSPLAITDLFKELGVEPEIDKSGPLERRSAPGLDIFVGDIFDLTAEALGPVDMVFDRAAVVALPGDMRTRYASHMPGLTGVAPQFVITFTYDQSQMDGPPFSITPAEIERLYAIPYRIRELASAPGDVRGVPVKETVWHLT